MVPKLPCSRSKYQSKIALPFAHCTVFPISKTGKAGTAGHTYLTLPERTHSSARNPHLFIRLGWVLRSE